MDGSEKQIKRANDIIEEKIKEAATLVYGVKTIATTQLEELTIRNGCEAIIAQLRQIKNSNIHASKIIDAKNSKIWLRPLNQMIEPHEILVMVDCFINHINSIPAKQ